MAAVDALGAHVIVAVWVRAHVVAGTDEAAVGVGALAGVIGIVEELVAARGRELIGARVFARTADGARARGVGEDASWGTGLCGCRAGLRRVNVGGCLAALAGLLGGDERVSVCGLVRVGVERVVAHENVCLDWRSEWALRIGRKPLRDRGTHS